MVDKCNGQAYIVYVELYFQHYQPLGIYLVLVGVEVWTDRDRITVNSSDVDATLIRWYEYRQNFVNPLHYNDNGVLIT